MSQPLKERRHIARESNSPSQCQPSTCSLRSAQILAFLIPLLFAIPPLPAQITGNNEGSRFVALPTGEKVIEWFGKSGRTYFIQISDGNDPLAKWDWAPLIESGNDEPISHEVISSADKGFFRLQYTDQTAPDLDAADFDGDGISNLGEITPVVIGNNTVQTNPLDPDTDHDGLSDKWERDHGLDPTDGGSVDLANGPNGDIDEDGLTNAEEQAFGTDPKDADTDNDGLSDKDEAINNTNPTEADTDGDLVNDGDDADPNEPLVDWPRISDSPYVLIDLEVPSDAGSASDLNGKAEVLFGTGIWAGGTWIPKIADEITGVFPGSVSESYPDGIGYRVPSTDWDFFNNDGQLLQNSSIHPTEGPGVDSGLPCPVFWPSGQSTPSLIYETANLWDDLYWFIWPVGVSTAGDMVIRTRPLDAPSGATVITERMDRFDATGAFVGSMDGTDGYHPTGQGLHGDMTSSGWVASNLARAAAGTQPSAYKVGLWNAANELQTLPAEADGWGYPVNVSDLPNSKVVLVAGQTAGDAHSGRVFLPDTSGQMKYSSSLSNHKIQLFAGNGTGITTDGKLWRNGKLTPLREISTKYKDLEDEEYSLYPRKANKNGVFLISTEAPDGAIQTKLGAPVEIEQESYNSSKGIRFCRWLDSFTSTGSMRANAAEVDRDRFRIRIPMIVPNLTHMKIKATGLNGAVIDGGLVAKAVDGDYAVDMKPENGAMVSEWILLVSDGDDDKKFNGKGTDDGENDQTLLADFDSKIIVTFPELANAEAEFKAQKAVGKITLNIQYLSPTGTLPPDKLALMLLHVGKMKEIYRQIGIKVNLYAASGAAIPQEWLNARIAPSVEPENYLGGSECRALNHQIRSRVVPENQIRIGFVDAELNPEDSSFFRARGWTYLGEDGITVSLKEGNFLVLGITAHEVGHTFGLVHLAAKHLLMYKEEFFWRNDEGDSKRFETGDFDTIESKKSYYVPLQ